MKHNKKFGGKVKLKMKTHQELFAFNVYAKVHCTFFIFHQPLNLQYSFKQIPHQIIIIIIKINVIKNKNRQKKETINEKMIKINGK